MAHRVVWSPTALEDVEAIAVYISRDSTSYAAAVVNRILDLTRQLENFPYSGRVVPEFDNSSLRELFVYSYRIIYRVGDETVVIAAVVHGKRLLDQLLPGELSQG